MGFLIGTILIVGTGLGLVSLAFTASYSSGESGNDSTSIYIGSNNDNGK